MRVRFNPTVAEMDCAPLDPADGPVLIELSTKGEIVLHNYDREAEAAAMALGFDPSKCFEVENTWHLIVYDAIAHPGRCEISCNRLLPTAIKKQLLRVGPLIKKAAEQAFEETTYREPSSRWVDTAGMSFELTITGLRRTTDEYVYGAPKKVWHSKFGKRNYPGVAVDLVLRTSVVSYLTLLNKIPGGVVYDPKQDVWCLAAAVVKVIDRNTAVVSAGKQGRGVAVESLKALVQKAADGNWVVQRWL